MYFFTETTEAVPLPTFEDRFDLKRFEEIVRNYASSNQLKARLRELGLDTRLVYGSRLCEKNGGHFLRVTNVPFFETGLKVSASQYVKAIHEYVCDLFQVKCPCYVMWLITRLRESDIYFVDGRNQVRHVSTLEITNRFEKLLNIYNYHTRKTARRTVVSRDFSARHRNLIKIVSSAPATTTPKKKPRPSQQLLIERNPFREVFAALFIHDDAFKIDLCEHLGERRSIFRQTRSNDEPQTEFIVCNLCNATLKRI